MTATNVVAAGDGRLLNRYRLSWEQDGADWPNRDASRFVLADGLRWHVQVMGQGPVLLLLHGTGAATHSWRDLAPLLGRFFTVVAPDLPGHGFTAAPRPGGFSLTSMGKAVASLLRLLGLTPDIAAGHSAGAAILVRMSLDGLIAPRALAGLNAALLPFHGIAGQVFAPVARLLAGAPIVPRLFAWRAEDPAMVETLIRNTGSRLDAAGVAFYGRLARSPAHVAAALGMMASWDLPGLQRDLPRLGVPLRLIVGGEDRAIPAGEAFRVREILPATDIRYLRGLGHLAHEEAPDRVAQCMADLHPGATPKSSG